MDKLTRKSYELRRDIIEMIYKSKAGHVGGDLSVIDILTVLYYDIMNVSPSNFKDDNRDRFLLSKGHCADALYVVLGDKGFFDKQEAIDTFSQYKSKFIGHPNTEVNGIPGSLPKLRALEHLHVVSHTADFINAKRMCGGKAEYQRLYKRIHI